MYNYIMMSHSTESAAAPGMAFAQELRYALPPRVLQLIHLLGLASLLNSHTKMLLRLTILAAMHVEAHPVSDDQALQEVLIEDIHI